MAYNFQKLSDAEMEVMDVIWDVKQPITTNELLEHFHEKGKDWKVQTLSTFLSRLVDKGVLVSRRKGRTNHYIQTISRKQYDQLEAQSVLNRMYKGSIKNFLAALYDGDRINQNDIDELKEWFKDK